MKHKALLIGTLLLSACFGGESDENPLVHVRSAQSGLRVSSSFMQILNIKHNIPAALTGPVYGVKISGTVSVLDHIPSPIPSGIEKDKVQVDTELLSSFVKLLKTDVQHLLNASPNREDALMQYKNSLESHVQRGQLRQRALDDQRNDLQDNNQRLSRLVRDLQKGLDTAIADGKSTEAISFTKELVDKQVLLATANAELSVTERLLDGYNDLLEPVQERLNAINANRPALIQGIRVIDIRGVEDIGVIEYEEGVPRFKSSRRKGIFQ